ncbi:MAG: proton-conducting transporter membrane subunit, partial [Myxococcota bacterium]
MTDAVDLRLGVAVAVPFVLALGAPAVVRWGRQLGAWILAGGIAALAGFVLIAYFPVLGGTSAAMRYPWAPSLGVNVTFVLDGLSLLFTVLISGVGTLVLLFAGAYLKGNPRLGYFLALILAFMGSMLGLVLAGDVVTLFVFWELTSVCSFLLIGFENERRASRRSALQALAVT